MNLEELITGGHIQWFWMLSAEVKCKADVKKEAEQRGLSKKDLKFLKRVFGVKKIKIRGPIEEAWVIPTDDLQMDLYEFLAWSGDRFPYPEKGTSENERV